MLWSKFVALSASIRDEKIFQINNLSSNIKKLEKNKQNESKVYTRKEIIQVGWTLLSKEF